MLERYVTQAYDYMDDDAKPPDACRGMVKLCEVGTPPSRGGLL